MGICKFVNRPLTFLKISASSGTDKCAYDVLSPSVKLFPDRFWQQQNTENVLNNHPNQTAFSAHGKYL